MSQNNPDNIDSQQIIQWLNEANLQHTELVADRLPVNIDFLSNVGGRPPTTIFVDQRMLSRLNFQVQLNISQQDQQILQNMQQPDFNERMVRLSDKMTNYDVNWNWQIAPNTRQQLQILRLSKFIDSSGLSRDRFYQTLSRLSIIGTQVIRELQFLFGNLQNPTNTQQNEDENPSFIN